MSVAKWEVEIYLLDSSILEAERSQSRIDHWALPFITNSEILGYQMVQSYPNREPVYSIVFNDIARDRLRELDIPVCCGRHFVIAVDKKPVLDGYFWSTYSSYSCDFLVIEVSSLNIFEIRNGYPKEHSFGNLPDPRRNRRLLQAFQKTKRLLRI
ncbi:hypothetical protein [Dyadobacter sp. BHUBP1]|uniref:hypothetical protein n=1 Tax=Dyadobacter sp. BHUBP1 TaxID=3424178 RepID=UPI003D352E3D